MKSFLISEKAISSQPGLQRIVRKYEQPNLLKAIWQLTNTFIPYIIFCILMYLSYKADYSY